MGVECQWHFLTCMCMSCKGKWYSESCLLFAYWNIFRIIFWGTHNFHVDPCAHFQYEMVGPTFHFSGAILLEKEPFWNDLCPVSPAILQKTYSWLGEAFRKGQNGPKCVIWWQCCGLISSSAKDGFEIAKRAGTIFLAESVRLRRVHADVCRKDWNQFSCKMVWCQRDHSPQKVRVEQIMLQSGLVEKNVFLSFGPKKNIDFGSGSGKKDCNVSQGSGIGTR